MRPGLREKGSSAGAGRSLPWIFTAGAVAALILFPTAPDASAEDLHLSAGLKGGWTRWEATLGGDRISSGFGLIGGPEIGLTRGPVFAGLQLAAGRFTFGDRRLCSGASCQEAKDGRANLLQLETGIGYYARPWLGPYIGYLYQRQNLKFTLSADGKSTTNQSLGILVLGALLDHSWLGQRAEIYGNVAALGPGSGAGLGGLAEAGISYAARSLPLGYTLSVRYQFFHYDRGELVLNGRPRTRDEVIGFNPWVHLTK